MSRLHRAAQFSPFAALTGYESSIAETARRTSRKIELDENAKSILDAKFLMIMEYLSHGGTRNHQEVKVTYFIPDPHKEGGSYRTVSGVIIKINRSERTIVLSTGNDFDENSAEHSRPEYHRNESVIAIDRIIDLQGTIFHSLEEHSS